MAKKKTSSADAKVGAAAGMVTAGAFLVLLGNMQGGNIKPFLAGFGSALFVVGAVLLGMATSK